ncbi:LysM peptidoglycan-binding domain-containing protein [Fulvivirga lutimaris]|uniref:LysM peptidoglycan-binding domain-containing protein n=1 Tax=Fulvivirga lutimaris TaxID=1819566 RepID=UPI0012BBE186|nr:LysM peptidoglycan-binding domain-containing protein [Fulvivirga lutimaris]MTI40094.1 LysM peptidoglycan-binding domain-containing protein [Fulvivirga lutimaris]
MIRFFCLAFVVFFSGSAVAQQVKVPSRMEFAGIKLRIMDDARDEIQKDVDALTASPKYFEIKAERARTYFPIIERIFKEEKLPDDFKYLCLQESALIADAVSSSNAVGFWQFKDFSAVEVGMRVDKVVDERMNIVSASRGAARYLHNNNQHFDNWLHALQAYQMGAGGAMKALPPGQEGAKSMTVNKKTYWYVKKYLAHKIAFENSVSQQGQIQVSEYYNVGGKTLKEIAKEAGVTEEELADYNKWLKKGKVPTDKKYAVIIPKGNLNLDIVASNETPKEEAKEKKQIEYTFDEPGVFPKIHDEIEARAGKIVDINGLPGIIAGRNDRIPALAQKADIPLRKFLKYNDLGIDGILIPGQVYYMKSKRGKAKAYYHVAQPGETLWSISQKFGIKLKKLKTKNRIKDNISIKAGRVLWLRYIRPASVPIEYKEEEVIQPIVEIKEPEIIKQPVEKEPVIESAPEEMEAVNDSSAVVIEELPVEEEVQPVETAIDIEGEVVEEIEDEDLAEDVNLIRKMHEVKLGETYYAISKIHDVAVLDLLDWNNLKISDKLSVGQKLVVYTTEEAQGPIVKTVERQSENGYHTVKPGETMYQIARLYNVSVQEIMKWNEKEDFNIKEGEKLKIGE